MQKFSLRSVVICGSLALLIIELGGLALVLTCSTYSNCDIKIIEQLLYLSPNVSSIGPVGNRKVAQNSTLKTQEFPPNGGTIRVLLLPLNPLEHLFSGLVKRIIGSYSVKLSPELWSTRGAETLYCTLNRLKVIRNYFSLFSL